MKFIKLLKLRTYLNLLKKIAHKSIIYNLEREKYYSTQIARIWLINNAFIKNIHWTDFYTIFSKTIDLNNVVWDKDYVTSFSFPLERFDKLKISNWFDRGIDIKFPWELSRFYFAVELAQKYSVNKEQKYYIQFKELCKDWLQKNPFLYGVNWLCTMEVALRAINWIIAINIFQGVFEKDTEFVKILSRSLVQHAEYIARFPEIGKNGHTNNHTTADYTGLLFLALSLPQHPHAGKWLQLARNGIVECMEKQVYKDGVNFEGSIPYHRLVLEMFGYAAVLCRANQIELPDNYYQKLFKMYEFTAAYMDSKGNAPQVGDNDSGRIIVFQHLEEQDHSYLLDLGEHIYNYQFKSKCTNRNEQFSKSLPVIEKIDIHTIKAQPRHTDKSIMFADGGYFVLKNPSFDVTFISFPKGHYGKTGHSHLDIGSFCLSVHGNPLVVDPGSFTYTRSKKDRDKFRAFNSHNVAIVEDCPDFNLTSKGFFELQIQDKTDIKQFSANEILFTHNYFNSGYKRIIKLDESKFCISDEYDETYTVIYHLSPFIKISGKTNNEIKLEFIDNGVILVIKSNNEIHLENYNYSPAFGVTSSCPILLIPGKNVINTEFILK